MPYNKLDDLAANNTSRYQTKYLHISFQNRINKTELTEFFSTKGLQEIALFKKANVYVAFLVYDIPKDFKIRNSNLMIQTPNYLKDFLGPVSLQTFSKNKQDFDVAVKLFKDSFQKESFKPLIYAEDNFFVSLQIKDFDYFTNLFEFRDVNAMGFVELQHYKTEFNAASEKLRRFLVDYNTSLNQFNSILTLKQLPTIKSVLDPKLDHALNFEEDRLFSKQDLLLSQDKLANALNSNSPKQSAQTQKVLKSPKYDGFMIEYEPFIIKMGQKEEYNGILKNLSIEDQTKILNIFEKDIAKKQFLEYLISQDKQYLACMLDVFKEKNKINFSNTKNRAIRLIATYLGKKALPKSSDPNVWIVELKHEMPISLLEFYKKYVKKL